MNGYGCALENKKIRKIDNLLVQQFWIPSPRWLDYEDRSKIPSQIWTDNSKVLRKFSRSDFLIFESAPVHMVYVLRHPKGEVTMVTKRFENTDGMTVRWWVPSSRGHHNTLCQGMIYKCAYCGVAELDMFECHISSCN